MTAPPPHPRYAAPLVLLVGALLVLAVAWGVASLLWPYQPDHGVYAWIARVMLDGGAPYMDAWDVKGPAAALPFVVSAALLGDGAWAIRALDALLVFATAGAIAWVVRAYGGWLMAGLAASSWVLAYATLGFTNTAQPDGWVAMLVFLACAPALRPGQVGPLVPLAIGLASGFALGVKPFYMLYFAAALVVAWEGAAGRRSLRLAMATVGLVIPVAMLLWYLAAHGALGEMWNAYVQFNFAKNSGGLVTVVLAALSYGLLMDPSLMLFAPPAAAGFAALEWRRTQRREAAVLLVLVGTGVVAALLQRPWYAYRALLLLPPIAAAAGMGWAAVDRSLPDTRRPMRFVLGAAAVLLLLHIAREPVADVVRAARVQSGSVPRETFDEQFVSHGASATDERAIAAAIAERAAPGDSAFVWVHLAILSYTHVPAASRSLLAVTLTGAPPWRAQFMGEIRAALSSRPAFLVLEAPGPADTAFRQLDPINVVSPAANVPDGYTLALVRGPLRLFVRQ